MLNMIDGFENGFCKKKVQSTGVRVRSHQEKAEAKSKKIKDKITNIKRNFSFSSV